jgi:hypothetical protein
MAWNASRHLIGAAALILSACSPSSVTGPPPAPSAAALPAESPGTVVTPVPQDWTVRVTPVGDARLDGRVRLVPSGTGDYDLVAGVFGESVLNHRFTWVLTGGTCAGRPVSDALLRETPRTDGGPLDRNSRGRQAFSLVLSRSWLTEPLFLFGNEFAPTFHPCRVRRQLAALLSVSIVSPAGWRDSAKGGSHGNHTEGGRRNRRRGLSPP